MCTILDIFILIMLAVKMIFYAKQYINSIGLKTNDFKYTFHLFPSEVDRVTIYICFSQNV